MNKQWVYLFIGNFAGVFNDNLLKNAIIFIAIGWILPEWLDRSQLIALVSAALVLPYLILSPLGGKWAVRYSRLRVFRFFKLLEFPIMVLASVAFIFENVFIALISVFLMGIQSCLYSPAKYGLIRDIGGIDGSARGSGIFEAMAFGGILAGTVVAAWLSDHYSAWWLVVCFMVLALVGYWSVRQLRVEEYEGDAHLSGSIRLNPLRFIRSSYLLATQFRGINKAVAGIAFFWMVGGMLQMNIVIHSTSVLNLPNSSTGIIMALAAVGIITGNWLAGVLQQRTGKAGMITGGLAGMTLGSLVLCFVPLNAYGFAVVISLLAMSGGFYQVPWLTYIQQTESGQRSGQLLAYMNIMVFVFVLLGTLLFSLVNVVRPESSFLVFFVLLLLSAGMLLYTVIYFHRKKIFI